MLYDGLANNACVIYSHKKSATVKVTLCCFYYAITYIPIIDAGCAQVVEAMISLARAAMSAVLVL